MNMIGFDMGTSLPFISSNSTCWTAACVYNVDHRIIACVYNVDHRIMSLA